MAVAYPWVFDNGTSTSRTTAVSSADEIGQAADYASIPDDVAKAAWGADGLPTTRFGHMPSRASLETFGSALHAKVVIYGSVSWHTRSIWVNLGPKTISTATVNAYVFDVKTGKVIFRVKGMQGRSDEKSNGYKIAADIVLGTPLVTAVSGGPATPQEQRAVRIALDKAYQNWAPMTK
jgi:hypothetical protein